MKKLLALLLMGVVTLSFKNNDEKKLHFQFTIDQTNYILNSLSKQPYNEAAPIIQSIQVQAAPQLQDTIQKKKGN